MNEFRFQFVNFLLLVLLVGGMYWAFSTINNGVTYTKDDLVIVNDEVNPIPEEELDPVFEVEEDVSFEVSSEVIDNPNIELIEKLQDLINDDINMKQGSRGTRVGTVQKFLNIYFDTEKTIDNDYGPGTLADVKKFQTEEGLGADGLAGPNTYKKMIEVLKK